MSFCGISPRWTCRENLKYYENIPVGLTLAIIGKIKLSGFQHLQPHETKWHFQTKWPTAATVSSPLCRNSSMPLTCAVAMMGLLIPWEAGRQRMSVSRLAVISVGQAMRACVMRTPALPPPAPSVSCPALWLKSLLSHRLPCSSGSLGKCAPISRYSLWMYNGKKYTGDVAVHRCDCSASGRDSR